MRKLLLLGSCLCLVLSGRNAPGQNLFEADYGSGNLYEFTNGMTLQKGTFVSGLSNPQGLAFDSAGDLFEANGGSDSILEFTNGVATSKGTFATGFNNVAGPVFDGAGDLFEIDYASSTIFEFTNGVATKKGTFPASGLSGPAALAFDRSGNLFEADGTSGKIYEFTNGVAAHQGLFASGLSNPSALAFDSAGDLFEADESSGRIYEFTNCLATKRGAFASGLSDPFSLAFDSAGDLFEADFGSGKIIEFTNGMAANKGTFASGLSDPRIVAFEPYPAAFSGLSASPSIAYGTTSIALAGKVSATSPTTYPAVGETITVTINGNAQTTTIADTTGDFTITYTNNLSTLASGAPPYTIGYSYGGDNWLLGAGSNLLAATNGTTTLTVIAPLDHFAISAIASPQTAGTAFTVATITAQDAGNHTMTNFTGTVTFGGTARVTGVSAPFTAGVLQNASVTPLVAGANLTLTVSDGFGHAGSATFNTFVPTGLGLTSSLFVSNPDSGYFDSGSICEFSISMGYEEPTFDTGLV
jgi:hypothetical protein